MKPNFALSLSVEGIRLLHRSAGGWHSIGDVSFDAEDMSAKLAMLRKTAAALEPGGVRTKLLIPNDQIKFMTLDTPGISDADRISEANRALEGATPYAVEDLAFDISSAGGQTYIAAVARETLAEAETFATAHRFHPVSFVAQPDAGQFQGEPFFGQTNAAETLLDAGDKVEPDEYALVVLRPGEAPAGNISAQDKDNATQNPETAPSEALLEEDEEGKDPDAPTPSADQKQGDVPEVEAETAQADDIPEDPDPVEPAAAPTPFSSRRAATSPSVGATTRGAATAMTPPAGYTPVSGDRATAKPVISADIRPQPVPDSSSLSTTANDTSSSKKLKFLSRRTSAEKATAALVKDAGYTSGRPDSEAEKMMIFGARKSNGVGGKPRFLALLLTAGLLVFLAGVAAWASVFLDDGISLSRLFSNRDTTATASAPSPIADPVLAAPANATDAPNAPMPPKEERVAALAPGLTDEDGAVLDALRVPERAAPRVLSRQEIEAKYATSGIWPLAPETPGAPAMIPIDDLYMTSIDPVSTANDAVALPARASFGGDEFDFAPSSPAPPGTTFALDDSGMVIPTPDGALNADGVKIIAGRPPVEPPQSVIRGAETPQSGQDAPPRQALLDLRPVERPEGLVESNERSNLGGLTRNELKTLRPVLRPQSLQQEAAAAAPEAPDSSTSVNASLAALGTRPPNPADNVLQNVTPYAVQTSLRPDTRPRNFAKIVQRAERNRPEPIQVASAASLVPRTVKPTLPSKASVAKQATVKNAIKLRKINLIGVYGKPSSRRALVRLANGRYQKVTVGDRLDGGRVSAIGESELRYTRSGRDVVLKMPRS
ncbi:hypothetical protein SAMN04488040_1595 [Sulfitobacter marinus]|uniref:Type IV pilus biogenesis protein PilP n=1 Tax=Sulfitobacter marinus TaxID=394264 RepID=A0A1I6RW51_9RHOB|nr:hypothetical protein [Sulfitobacter marinus]SFS68934.1 hypothetical protein SAMN04488040_1595 [Sulfitobacter marinus]